MVRERRAGNLEFFLNIPDDEAFGMRGQQQLHDAQARFGSHGREHVGVPGDLVCTGIFGGTPHMSIVLEI
jgi:hypothetical protein